MSESEKLWAELQNLPIDMFGLPRQRIKHHVEKLAGTDTSLYLKLTSSAVLPALETALAVNVQLVTEDKYDRHHQGEDVDVEYPKYSMEEAEGYIIVSRFVPPTKEPKLKAEVFVSNKAKKKTSAKVKN